MFVHPPLQSVECEVNHYLASRQARPRRLRLGDPELYERTVAASSAQGGYLLSARPRPPVIRAFCVPDASAGPNGERDLLFRNHSARPRPPVISNGASRLFSSVSLLRSGRLAQREISLPLSSAPLLRGGGAHALARHQGRSYRSNYLGKITAQRLDANIGESISEGFARKSWNGTKPPALDATPSSSAADECPISRITGQVKTTCPVKAFIGT
jgi:hypothetical protein